MSEHTKPFFTGRSEVWEEVFQKGGFDFTIDEGHRDYLDRYD